MPMTAEQAAPSARREELLQLAYQYAVAHGRADLSLRPIAAAIGSSPRVLLYLFGSKDGLIRALLAKARADELAMLAGFRQAGRPGGPGTGPATGGGPAGTGGGTLATGVRPPAAGAGLAATAELTWSWLADESHRPLLRLWLDVYCRSLTDPAGPWAGFATGTVADWLDLLADAQPPAERHTEAALADRTAVLAILRGALLDLLATGDTVRTSAAVARSLAACSRPPAS
jgi:AcrR family transcriptional regulator